MLNRMLIASLVILAGSSLSLAAPESAPAAPAAKAGGSPAAPMTSQSMNLNQPIPSDPSLVKGTLENGLSYIIKKHGNPEGRISVWMHISSGSLNEIESTRGIAHFLEHMAFNGSENFAPGTVVNFFQSMGLQFGRDQNAFTSFDQTVYQLALPDTKPETIEKAMLFMSDVNGRLLLKIEEIDSERGIIQEERRTRLGSQQRIQEYVLERLAPESTFGRRLPIGTVETINSVKREDFLKYWSTFYVPSNTTVVVVGDVDPEAVKPQIAKAFGNLKKVDRPKDLPVGVKPSQGLRAIVATDPDLKSARVEFSRFWPADPTITTLNDERRDLVELIGTWAFNRRIAADLEKGKGRFLSASAGVSDLMKEAKNSQFSASGQPEKWRDMLTDLGIAAQRARLHGFTDQEVADAREALISDAEESVKREATLPASAVIRRITSAVNEGEPIPSASQRLEILKGLLPTITAKEVSETFTKVFDPSAGTFIVNLPSTPPTASVPSESELVELGKQAFSVKPEAQAADARITSLLKSEPTPGKAEQTATHAGTQVTSSWLSNGARLHVRKVDQRKNEASIQILLATGEILETPANRGITSAATLAFGPGQASSTISSTQIREFMTGKKVRVAGGSAGDDAVSLGISGSPEAFETGLQLAHLLLTDPKIEPAVFSRWKEAQAQGIKRRKQEPAGVMGETLAEALYPAGEMRTRPLEQAHIDALTLDAAQAWLKDKIITAPMEITVVGDIDPALATAMVEKYLGSLPKRERIKSDMYASLRKIQRPTGPIAVTKKVATKTPQAMVIDGFFAADYTNLADVRTLQMASRILSTRMIKTVREDKQLVYSIGASSRPSGAFPGYGLFTAQAPTDPSKAEALPATLDEMYTEFAKAGPTPEELATAQLQLDKALEEQMKEPDFWAARLSSLDYRGNSLDDVLTLREFYKTLTPEQVKTVFAKYAVPANRFRVTVTPE